ncbi:hypothetical protein C1646_768290 [Rhizophagus diaphanus]|nr:hypothetical protein C1646_768290 [Rhizophagus diaphanus] [Rhizophagus sp. MUCL 43196]
MKLVHFFKASHWTGAELTNEIKENIVNGGKLKRYCQTRWMTAFDCISSVLKCKEVLKNVEEEFDGKNEDYDDTKDELEIGGIIRSAKELLDQQFNDDDNV